MARDNPPKHPSEKPEGDKKANRIAAMGQQISEPLRGLFNQFVALINEIKTNNEATETREKEYQDHSLRWVKRGTVWAIVFSALNLVLSGGVAVILYNQLHAQRIEHRAWIKIEHTPIPVAENKPLIAGLTVRNIGKTPASIVEGRFIVRIVKKDIAPDLRLVGDGFSASAGIMMPDEGMPAPAPMLDKTSDLLNLPRLTKTEFAEIDSGESYIVTFGRVTYFDAYGISHWTDFCSYQWRRPGNYAARNCVEYNKADKN